MTFRFKEANLLVLVNASNVWLYCLDGWFYAGNGRVSRDTGKKALIVGRDSPSLYVI
jgi:hypothetical protein